MKAALICLLVLGATGCWSSTPSESPSPSPTPMPTTGWAVKEVYQTKDYTGQYMGSGDKVIFANGQTSLPPGYAVEHVSSYPKTGEPKIHLFSSADCWECEPAMILQVYAVATQSYKALPYPGQVNAVDPMEDANNFIGYEAKGYVGECGDYVVVVSAKSRESKGAPLVLVSVEGLKLTSSGALESIKKEGKDPEAQRILDAVAAAGAKCQPIPGQDTHQYQ